MHVDYFKKKNKYKCKKCGIVFQPRHHGLNRPRYCSWKCANTALAERRQKLSEEKRKKEPKRICQQCNKEYEIQPVYSLSQYRIRKFCSIKCFAESRKINDGTTKYQRAARRMGVPKRGSPEWIEKIRARTKEAMYRPDVNEKLHKPKRSMSLEARIKRSNALAGRMPKNMMFGASNEFGPFKNVQRGDYENSKGTMYFRSKWEANYALFLDFLVGKKEIENWEYEADVFVFDQIQFGTRSYRPDFKVFYSNGGFEYHEVKGYMDSKSKTKLKRMAKYYPEVKIVLIDSIYYRDLNKKMGRVLGFY
jgi:transposase-like protein